MFLIKGRVQVSKSKTIGYHFIYILLFVRFCHIQYEDLADNILDGAEKEYSPWTVEEYDAIPTADEDQVHDTGGEEEEDVASHLFSEYDDPSDESDNVETDDDDIENTSNFGVKRKCVFNTLKPFHCVTSMPPDSMHDLMEGKYSYTASGFGNQ